MLLFVGEVVAWRMWEYINCRNYTVESKLGEYPGVFIILTICLIIGSFLFFILNTYYNSLEEENININIFLNKRISEILFFGVAIVVSGFFCLFV